MGPVSLEPFLRLSFSLKQVLSPIEGCSSAEGSCHLTKCLLLGWVWLCCLFELLAAIIVDPGVHYADAKGSVVLILSWSALAERWCLSHVFVLISAELLLCRSCKTCWGACRVCELSL